MEITNDNVIGILFSILLQNRPKLAAAGRSGEHGLCTMRECDVALGN
jgi:hypothetical protein